VCPRRSVSWLHNWLSASQTDIIDPTLVTSTDVLAPLRDLRDMLYNIENTECFPITVVIECGS